MSRIPQVNPAVPAITPPAEVGAALALPETVPPAQMGAALAADAAQKAKFGTIHLIIRGFLCTPFLAYGAATVFVMVAAGVPLAVAGLVFPAGYVTLSFLGLEMATGSFAVMPIGMYAGTITPSELVRNWTWTSNGQPARRLILRLAALVLMDLRGVRRAPCSRPEAPAHRHRPGRRAQDRVYEVRRPWLVRRHWHGCPL